MKIASRNIILSPVSKIDFPILYQFRNKNSFLEFCTGRRGLLSFEDFCIEIKGDFRKDRHIQYVIKRKRDGVCIGTIFSYNYNKTDGYAFVTTFIDDQFQYLGYGIEAFLLFVSFLFHKFKLYKIYMDVYEFNKHSLSNLKKTRIFIEEGRFIKQKLFNKRRYDVLRFACYGKDLPLIDFFLRNFNKRTSFKD